MCYIDPNCKCASCQMEREYEAKLDAEQKGDEQNA